MWLRKSSRTRSAQIRSSAGPTGRGAPQRVPALLFAAAVKYVAGLGAGVLAVIDGENTVHDHVFDAGGILQRLFKRGLVADRVCVEHGDVRGHAGAQDAAVAESIHLRGQ